MISGIHVCRIVALSWHQSLEEGCNFQRPAKENLVMMPMFSMFAGR
jgi:hypothetical protein